MEPAPVSAQGAVRLTEGNRPNVKAVTMCPSCHARTMQFGVPGK